MLDGITLLDTGTKVVSYTWGWSWGGFIAAIFAIFLFVISILCTIDGAGGYGAFIGGIVCIMLSLFMFSHAKPAKIITTYSVMIDDSVSMTEFYDKYEVLNIEGKIFTITEREDTD